MSLNVRAGSRHLAIDNMKHILLSAWALGGWLVLTTTAQTVVTPKLGGGQESADMVHIDVYYDETANQLHTQIDASYGIPELRQLEPGMVFAPDKPYAVLNGKAYNAQYGWNVGGFFALPPGSAIWIEQLDASTGLEVYEGWGQNGGYDPIFGTGSSSRLWLWSGVMVHNTYAIRHPATDRLSALYHVYFGDAVTGSSAGFEDYDDAFVQLEWNTTAVASPVCFNLGAVAPTNNASLRFINEAEYVTRNQQVIHLPAADASVGSLPFRGQISLAAQPATGLTGGPAPQHAAPGSILAVQFESLSGPCQASLEIWQTNSGSSKIVLHAGETGGTNRFQVSSDQAVAWGDPSGLLNTWLHVSHPGLYCLGFRIIDTSIHDPFKGPIHAPSELYEVYLQAGITVAKLTRHESSVSVGFAGKSGIQFYLESSTLPGVPIWQTVAGPLSGANQLQEFVHNSGPDAWRFYRLRGESRPAP
jgi:hypothetical protein